MSRRTGVEGVLVWKDGEGLPHYTVSQSNLHPHLCLQTIPSHPTPDLTSEQILTRWNFVVFRKVLSAVVRVTKDYDSLFVSLAIKSELLLKMITQSPQCQLQLYGEH